MRTNHCGSEWGFPKTWESHGIANQTHVECLAGAYISATGLQREREIVRRVLTRCCCYATNVWLHGLLAGVASCLVAPPLHAQHATLARIEGIATDSIQGGMLSGALVLLARRTSDTIVTRSATTDAAGRFAFDSLPPGDYLVSLESSLLDSLEVALPVETIAVASGDRKTVRLATPSGAGLRSLFCPGVLLRSGAGALLGQVYDARDGRPLRDAELSLRWSETTVDRTTLRATNTVRGVDLQTDSLGRFKVCGAPTDTYLDLTASAESYQEVLLQLVVSEDAGVRRQNLSLRPKEKGEGRVAARESVAMVKGTIFGTTTPLSHVQVQRRGNSTVTSTDSLGRYELSAVPIGTQVIELRKVGYLPRQVTLEVRRGQNTAPDVHLTPIATLDSIRVTAQRAQYREFDNRAKAASFGVFLRSEDIARKKPLLTSDLIRQLPGFQIVRHGTSDLDVDVVDSRGITSLNSPASCAVKIFIDGVPHQGINWIDPGSIGAMEIYRGTSTGPVQYQGPCGTILIWTKRY